MKKSKRSFSKKLLVGALIYVLSLISVYIFVMAGEISEVDEPITACGNGIRPDHVRYKPWFIEEIKEDEFVNGYIPFPGERPADPVGDDISFTDAKRDLREESGEESGEESADGITYPVPSAYPCSFDEKDELKTYVKENLPPLRSQGKEGLCWAFSALGTIETYMIRHGKSDLKGVAGVKDTDYSELHLGYFAYHQTKDPVLGDRGDTLSLNDGESVLAGGNQLIAAMSMSAGKGIADESVFPYELSESISENRSAFSEDKAYDENVAAFSDLYMINRENNSRQVKQAIMENGAVSVSYYSDDSNYNAVYHSYYGNEKTKTNHAVMIVGWDDDFSAEYFDKRPEGDGAWLIRNSWLDERKNPFSETFGKTGYFWISYYDTSLSENVYSFEARSEDITPLNNYHYTNSIYGYGSYDVDAYSNVYTVSAGADKEILKSVRLFLQSGQSDFEIEIYKGVEEGKDPSSGKLIQGATTRRKADFSGIYTVDLNEPVELYAGERFAVVVKTDGRVYHEKPLSLSFATATAGINPGESFYLYKNSWKDFSTLTNSDHGNFCIYALTENGSDERDRIGGEKAVVSGNEAAVHLSWKGQSGAEGYELYRADTILGDGFGKEMTVEGANEVTRSIEPGVGNFYRILPVYKGRGVFERRSRIFSAILEDMTVEQIPELNAARVTATNSPVIRAGKEKEIDGCMFEYRKAGGDWTVIPSTSNSTLFYANVGTLPVGIYDFRARYYKAGTIPVFGDYSKTYTRTIYREPELISVSYNGAGISLSWNGVENADRFIVYTGDGKALSLNGQSTVITSGVTEGDTVYIQILGYNSKDGSLNGYPFSKRTGVNVYCGRGCFVSFDSDGGGALDSVYQQYGTTLTSLPEPVKNGYVFDGWYLNGEEYDMSSPLTQDLVLTAKWKTAPLHYRVKHYKQAFNGDYLIAKTERYEGRQGETVTPKVEDFEGFKAPLAQSAVVESDDCVAVRYYYDRNRYDVKTVCSEGVKSISGSGRYYYEESVSLNAVLEEGYELSGFFTAEGRIESSFDMPAGDLNITAVAVKKDDGKSSSESSSEKGESGSSSDKKDTGSFSDKDDSGSSSVKDPSGSSSRKLPDSGSGKDEPGVSEDGIYGGADGRKYRIAPFEMPVFNGKKQAPDLTIYDPTGRILTPGVDYRVTIKNGKNATLEYNTAAMEYERIAGAKPPQIVIKFKGAYKTSKQIVIPYDILPVSLSQNGVITPKNTLITAGAGKSFKYLKSVTLPLRGRVKKLNLKKDVYVNSIMIEDMDTGKVYRTGSESLAPAGSYRILLTGRGNYSGTLSGGEFRLIRE